MEQLIGTLRYEVLDETRHGRCLVRLLEPFVYRLCIGGFWLEIEVPAGFISDLTSIPRILWSFFPPDGPYQRAAVIHDYLYSIAAPRWICDAVFRHVMEMISTPGLRRMLMFYGVRIGGWESWGHYKRRLAMTNGY